MIVKNKQGVMVKQEIITVYSPGRGWERPLLAI